MTQLSILPSWSQEDQTQISHLQASEAPRCKFLTWHKPAPCAEPALALPPGARLGHLDIHPARTQGPAPGEEKTSSSSRAPEELKTFSSTLSECPIPSGWVQQSPAWRPACPESRSPMPRASHALWKPNTRGNLTQGHLSINHHHAQCQRAQAPLWISFHFFGSPCHFENQLRSLMMGADMMRDGIAERAPSFK